MVHPHQCPGQRLVGFAQTVVGVGRKYLGRRWGRAADAVRGRGASRVRNALSAAEIRLSSTKVVNANSCEGVVFLGGLDYGKRATWLHCWHEVPIFYPLSVPLSRLNETLASQGFALLDGRSVQQWLDVPASRSWPACNPLGIDMPSDNST